MSGEADDKTNWPTWPPSILDVRCSEHKPVQHRDARPPWCDSCGLTEKFTRPEMFPKPKPKDPNVPVDYPLLARTLVCDEINKLRMTKLEKERVFKDQVFIVWFAFVLGGWKALVSTTMEDSRYFEVTHNVAKRETYIDTYVKIQNTVVHD